MGKADRIASVLTRRIAQGDYLAAPLPSERVLADQEGVSYMTARKAVLSLIERGILTRTDTGRLVVKERGDGAARPLQIAFIAPPAHSPDLLQWRLAVERLLAPMGATAKIFPYAHWDDPLVRHALERCDGAFLYPLPEPAPERFLVFMAQQRVVVLDQDFSPWDLPSIRISPPSAIDQLLDHLVAGGRRPVTCLNVQPHDTTVADRIARWEAWCRRRGVEGRLIDRPVRMHDQTAVAAYEAMRDIDPAGHGFFATTVAAVFGLHRAIHERGLAMGRDIPVCTLNDEGLGAMHVPSITAAAAADPVPFLRRCLAWIEDPERKPWKGPRLMEPSGPGIAIRESTQPGR